MERPDTSIRGHSNLLFFKATREYQCGSRVLFSSLRRISRVKLSPASQKRVWKAQTILRGGIQTYYFIRTQEKVNVVLVCDSPVYDAKVGAVYHQHRKTVHGKIRHYARTFKRAQGKTLADFHGLNCQCYHQAVQTLQWEAFQTGMLYWGTDVFKTRSLGLVNTAAAQTLRELPGKPYLGCAGRLEN